MASDQILVVCPGNHATGGTEALHAFVSELNKVGADALLWYWSARGKDPMPAEYRRYGCEYVTDMPWGYDGTVIVPEIWANRVTEFQNCTRAIYWLGLDAYAGWHPKNRGAFLRDDEIIHIAQSEYAYDLLRKLRVSRLIKCTDTLNADFYEDYGEPDRGDEVLYNPAKATQFMSLIVRECENIGIRFRPIRGMARSEVIDAMRHSKLYVDFGEFPGRERMPREAVLCGCVTITSKIGAAYYAEDFGHDYKFESKEGHIWAIVNCIRYALDHYDECWKDFAPFRQKLMDERDLVKLQIKAVAHEIQHYHTGI